jgi:hypothetical protein
VLHLRVFGNGPVIAEVAGQLNRLPGARHAMRRRSSRAQGGAGHHPDGMTTRSRLAAKVGS